MPSLTIRSGAEGGNLILAEQHLPAGRRGHPGDGVEDGGLAGAVGPPIRVTISPSARCRETFLRAWTLP